MSEQMAWIGFVVWTGVFIMALRYMAKRWKQ